MSTIFANKIKNNQGGNNVKVNQLSGIDTAGSISVQGEGTATTNLQQGVAKAWLQMNGQSVSIAVGDNLNHSSITDYGTGLYDPVFTNPMANALYCSTGAGGELVDNGGNRMVGLRARATTGQHLRGFYDGNSASDLPDINLAVHGDLA